MGNASTLFIVLAHNLIRSISFKGTIFLTLSHYLIVKFGNTSHIIQWNLDKAYSQSQVLHISQKKIFPEGHFVIVMLFEWILPNISLVWEGNWLNSTLNVDLKAFELRLKVFDFWSAILNHRLHPYCLSTSHHLLLSNCQKYFQNFWTELYLSLLSPIS